MKSDIDTLVDKLYDAQESNQRLLGTLIGERKNPFNKFYEIRKKKKEDRYVKRYKPFSKD
jgi:hypothetical protein